MNKISGNFVGLLAGIAAGLMAIAAFNSGLASAPLIFITPLAIYIASMGWGTLSGVIAAIIACAFCYIYGGIGVAFSLGLSIFAPAAWIGHLSNLGQTSDDGDTIWYPLSNILFWLMLITATLCVVIFSLVDFNTAQTGEQLKAMLTQVAKTNPEIKIPNDEDIALTLQMLTKVMPIVTASILVIVHSINAYFSASITQSSQIMARKQENIAQTITLPKAALFIMAVGFIGTVFGDGVIAEICGAIFGASMTAFALLGLADAHLKARSTSGGTLMLVVAYTSIFMFSLPILVFTAIGVMRLFRMASQEANNNQPN